jgi:soluble lytic murein transglycosylase-like protein
MAARRDIVIVSFALCSLLSFVPAHARADVTPHARAVERSRASARAERRQLAAHVRAQVAARLRRSIGPEAERRLAQAIVAEAEMAGLDPLLVLALIHVESSFDPNAVSSAGAVGLMQLSEATMRRELERSGLPPADRLDPVASVQVGVRYLRRLVVAFGEVDVALMAYNAGPNRIARNLRGGGIPERFHSYPRRVKSELERQRRALGSSSARPPVQLAAR